MKHQNIRVLVLTIALCGWLASCKKDVPNIFNMFDVTLELHSGFPKAASEYNELTAGDSVVVDFTINSPSKDMYQVTVQKTGSNSATFKIPITDAGKRRTYSDKVTLKADKAGITTYRIWAVDKQGVYLGDGDKEIVVNVATDYRHLPNRKVYFPDSVGKTLPCYFSLEKATNYTYAMGAANAADIDFGIYQTVTLKSNGDKEIKNYIYSLSASPVPFKTYDISAWTPKRTTLFSSEIGSSSDFITKLVTGVGIETAAKEKTIDRTSVEVKVGKYYFFLTPEGKYGALLVNAITADYLQQPFMNVNVKILP